jgi:hypothetical protein
VFRSGGITYTAVTSTVAIFVTDSGAGVSALNYGVDGVSYAVAAASATIPLTEGPHNIAYGAVDNVGNVSLVETLQINVGNLPSVRFIPVEKTATSILWGWELIEGAMAYRVFSSTGGPVSPFLAAGATEYLQTGISPNVRYSNFVRSYGESALESLSAQAVTLADMPEIPEVFDSGQNASLVIGQPDFVTTSGGTSSSKLNSPRGMAFDVAGALWIADVSNNRVLRFSPPFYTNQSADIVLGQTNFTSSGYPSLVSATTLPSPTALDFDAEGNLWVQDWTGRLLRFSPPFSAGMAADMAIGVDNCYASGGGVCAPNRISVGNWGQFAFDKNGSLWSSDYYNHRVLRFSPPFTMGMNADTVIGQPNFTSCSPGVYPYMPSAANFNSPLAVKSDSKGNIWIADYGFNRIVKYKPPFYLGMGASTVLGQKNLLEKNNLYGAYVPSASSLNAPAGLEFDGQDNLYVVDFGDKRVLKYRPPFSDGMPASIVIGQNDFDSVFNMNLQATFAFPMGVETSGFAATDEKGRLWVSDYNYNRILMFEPVRAGVFTGIGTSSFTVSWLPGENSPDTVYIVEISPYEDFSSQILGSGYLSQHSYTFTELSDNSRYYVRAKAKNLDGLETESVYLGFAKTKLGEIISVSTVTLNGNPEAAFSSSKESTIVLLSTTSQAGTVVLGAAAEAGLTLASNLYEIGPEGEYDPPAVLTFYYTEETLSALGLLAGDIAIYEHFADTGWVKLPDQELDAANHRIRVPVSRIASEFAIFGIVKDRHPPVTGFSIAGSSWTAEEEFFISPNSSITFTVSDPVRYGTSTGVAFTEFRVDGSSVPGFNLYEGPFNLPAGLHTVEYRSADNAGNLEDVRLRAVTVDAYPPESGLLLSGTTGQGGWYVSPITTVIISTDGLSGVKATHYSIDGASVVVYASSLAVVSEGRHTLEFYSVDNVGNTEAPHEVSFGIDQSSPVVAYSLAPQPDPNGWSRTSVDVVFTGTDAVSGIAYCSSSFTVSGEGVGLPVAGYCSDYAGWTSAVAFSLNIDTTAPVSNAGLTAAAGLNGWLVSPAVVQLASTDSLSGLGSLYYSMDGSSFALYSSSFVVAGEGDHHLRYYADDKAGNREEEKSLAFKLDLAAPSVVAASSPTANSLGWNNTAVTAFFSGVDSVSGLAYCEPEKSLVAEGSSQTVSGYCMDHAGWSSTAAVVINIDTTGPGISYTAVPAANGAGWNNGDVTLNFTCEDALSGVGVCPGDIRLTGEGVGISTSAFVSDRAGNIAHVTAAVNIDLTGPAASALAVPSPNEYGWNNTQVEVSFSGNDALSGLAYCESPKTVSLQGSSMAVSGYCADNAGNSSTTTIAVSIDTAAPRVSYALEPAANANGWNNTAVRVVFSGTDVLSGIEHCSSVTLSGEGAGHAAVGNCADRAGNMAYATATVNIDMTPAEIVISSPLAGQTFIATRGKIGIGFTVMDNLDPAPAVEAFLVQVEDRGSPRGARPARIAVASGQALEPLDIDDGLWRLAVSATDFADNAAYLEGGAFEVIHDVLAPRSTLEVSGPVYRPAGMTYLASAALFTLASTDDLVAVGDGTGLGVKNQSAVLMSRERSVKELSFMNPLPKQGEVFASTFGFTALGDLADGLYSLSYNAQDILANAEPSRNMSFALDNTPPLTGFNVAGASHEGQDRVFIAGTSGLSLAGVDVSSGGAASGLMLTKYKLDGGSWQVYAGSFTITAEGLHTLVYQSLDNVQNMEPERSQVIVVDNTPPAAAITLGVPSFNVFGLPVITPETPLTLLAGDPGAAGLASGLKSIYYELLDAAGNSFGVLNYIEPFRITGQGTYIVRCWAVDNVGNIGANSEIKIAVSSLQNNALAAVDRLDMTGSAVIAGRVESAGSVELNGNPRILGDVYASTITLKGKAQITGIQAPVTPGFVAEPLDMAYIAAKATAVNNNDLVPAQYLVGGGLVVSANAEVILSTGTYYFTGIDLSGGCKVRIGGKVAILVAGDVKISGGSSLNAEGASSGLNVVVSTASELIFTGGGDLAAYVYAPYSDLKLTGNALLGGHYFVRTAMLSGTGNIIQSGETLPQTATATGDTGGGRQKVSAFAASAESFSVLAGPDAAFRLGEVYVFPNPALRGAAPTLHIEVGVADRVKITIYTVSGRRAHETTLTGMPAALDDGDGLSYAYEYTWRDHIPSGVYYYHIEAEKGGEKLKKSGKFAVVR